MKKILLAMIFIFAFVPYGADAASRKLGNGNEDRNVQEFNKRSKTERDLSDPCLKKRCHGNLVCIVGTDNKASCGCTQNSHCGFGWKCNTSTNTCEVCNAGEKGTSCNCPDLKQADGHGACECVADPSTQSCSIAKYFDEDTCKCENCYASGKGTCGCSAYQEPQDGMCVGETCEGKFGVECVNCNTNLTACTSCAKGYYLNSNTCHKCTIENGLCLACEFVNNSVNCTEANCDEGYSYVVEGGIGVCKQCSEHCETCPANGGQCSKCEEGYYLKNGECLECPNGGYCDGSTQITCNPSYYLQGEECLDSCEYTQCKAGTTKTRCEEEGKNGCCCY
ncbi:MAG: hypothetical protein MJ250_03220 [Alphaproteobacteria bacterium]|nr:hypothetical protein [Alphaproteobacteria bacterium]